MAKEGKYLDYFISSMSSDYIGRLPWKIILLV